MPHLPLEWQGLAVKEGEKEKERREGRIYRDAEIRKMLWLASLMPTPEEQLCEADGVA